MKQQKVKPHNAIFIITREDSCPLYDIGEEIKVENYQLSLSSFKPGCLYLAEAIKEIIKPDPAATTFSQLGRQPARVSAKKSSFTCKGCGGTISFEYKQEKDYATVQMKMLRDTEMLRRKQHLQKFFGVLRKLDFFDALDDESLSELTLLLDLKTILPDKVVVKKGDPGGYLYIVLRGEVAVIGDDGSKMLSIAPGEVFGEMSLLSGEPALHPIHTTETSQLAILSDKNFKRVLKKHPILQMFLFKLLVNRAQTMTLQSGNISSGMTGELTEISVVDLLQLINSAGKTGTITLTADQSKAIVCFREGELVHAQFQDLLDKDALFAILSFKNGRFSYQRGISTEFERQPPFGDFMGLLMEGVQQLDEKEG